MKTTIISLGGSIIIPDRIDRVFLKKFKKLVLEHIKKDNRLVIVCGGGRLSRDYQQASKDLCNSNNEDQDWIGIMATRLNAELIRVMFKDEAYPKVVFNPTEKIKTNKKIIIGAGYEPGWSTDYDAVLLAKQFKAEQVINTTDTDYVYDKDPKKYSDAQIIEELTWTEYKKIIGGEFKSGMHAPFDPIASQLAQENKMKVIIVNGRNLKNLKKLLNGKEFVGSVIG